MGRVTGLDASLFIYVFEQHPTFRPPAKHVFRQIEQGKIRGVFSKVGVIELLTGAKRRKRLELINAYRTVVRTLPNLTTLGLTDDIVEIASDLRAKYGIRTPDAIHVATAIAGGADRFITNDRRLSRISEIKVQLLSARS